MGLSLFMATSLMWLLLKRILPVVKKRKQRQNRLEKDEHIIDFDILNLMCEARLTGHLNAASYAN